MPRPSQGPLPLSSAEFIHLGVRGLNPPRVQDQGPAPTLACTGLAQTSSFPGLLEPAW